MRKVSFCLLPLLALAACSHRQASPSTAARNDANPAAAAPATAASAPGNAPPAAPPAAQPALAGNPEPVDPPPPATAAYPASAPAPAPELRLPRGAVLRVRLDSTINTRRNRAGDPFTATLVRSLPARGGTIPAGTRFRGHITAAKASERLKGRAVLAVTLDSFEADGRRYPIRTSQVERFGKAHKRRDEKFIGGGSALGAIVGAIAGGGKGAAVGALAGAGAGTAGEAATGKEELAIPAESALVFRVM